MNKSAVTAGIVATLLAAQAMHLKSAPSPAELIIATNSGTLQSPKPARQASRATVTQVEDEKAEVAGVLTLSSGSAVLASGVLADRLIAVEQLLEPTVPIPNYDSYLPAVSSGFISDSFLAEEAQFTFEEMAPAPEPSTWFAALFAFVFLAWHQRRRFCRERATAVRLPLRVTVRRNNL